MTAISLSATPQCRQRMKSPAGRTPHARTCGAGRRKDCLRGLQLCDAAHACGRPQYTMRCLVHQRRR